MHHSTHSAHAHKVTRIGVIVLLATLVMPGAGFAAAHSTSAGIAAAAPAASLGAPAPAAWSGRYDLYRKGVFSTQQKITWCVAASVQMMLNIVNGTHDHSAANQERYIRYARKHDLFKNPSITGTDGLGWVAALRHFGGLDSYHIVASKHYRGAIRSAVKRLRLTGEPVGLVIEHHNHAWVLTGFESPTDPAVDPNFSLTAVYIMGPLYPRQQSNGLDPAPDSRLTYHQLRAYLTRYLDAAVKPNNPWEGKYVTIQP